MSVNQEKRHEDRDAGKLKQIKFESNSQDTGEGKSQNSSVADMTEPYSCLNREKRTQKTPLGKMELVDYIAGLNSVKTPFERHFTELISDIGRFSQIVTQ